MNQKNSITGIYRKTLFNSQTKKATGLVAFILFFLALSSTALAQNTMVPFNFTLNSASTTSAGIFRKDSTLVRTLWNNVKYKAGTHTAYWDGKDDDGHMVNDSNFVVHVVSSNIAYKWEGGIIGNTSDSMSGPSKHRYFEKPASMAIYGNTAYFSSGYGEGITSAYKLNLSTPQNRAGILSNVGDVDQNSDFTATDGTNVYWAGYDAFNPGASFVYGTTVSGDKEVKFSSGVSHGMTYGRTYAAAIDRYTGNSSAHPTGMAVQKSGSYLFVSHEGLNELHVLNKSTGALVQSISMTKPRALCVDMNDNLWVVSGTSTVQKFSVGSNGTLSSALLSISGLSDPVALCVSPNNYIIAIADAGSSQQVKAFSNASGKSIWTLGQAGGYATDATVKNDKFYFRDVNTKITGGVLLAFQQDSSFWIGDPGNDRVQHFSASRNYINNIMAMPCLYSVKADPNDPTKVFGNFLEFKIDYSKPLAANNGSWTLVKNWRRGNPSNFFGAFSILRNVITLSNGRTYATMEDPGNITHELVELPSTGNLRFTGIKFGTDEDFLIDKDGSLRTIITGGVNDSIIWKNRPLTGFSNNNPVWGTGITIASSPKTTLDDPKANGQTFPVKTSSNRMITFCQRKSDGYGYRGGYHLGAIKKGTNKWLWKASKATPSTYMGPMPSDGSFDLGNGVEYPAGGVYTIDNNIFWNYNGEFWKNSQTNIWNHYADNGLMIGQFGITAPEGQQLYGEQAFPMGAGNVFSSVFVKVDTSYYLYHNDESVHGAIHRWKITGLNTVKQQSSNIKLSSVSGGLTAVYFNGTELSNLAKAYTGIAQTVNLTSAPSQVSDGNKYSARWSGYVKPAYTQSYTFSTTTTKGVKLWIDGKLVINQWNNTSSASYNSSAIALTSGIKYSIRMETNGGTASLSWSSSSQAKQVIPSGNLYPAPVDQEQGIDLLEGLYGKTTLEDNSFGWKRNSTSEDSSNSQQFWHVRTGVKSFLNEKPDLFITFRHQSATHYVTRTLGNADTGYSTWKVSGTLNYDGDRGKWTDDDAGTYFDILDDQGKVIARITHEQYLTGGQFNNQLNFNSKVAIDRPEKIMEAIISKHQPFEISATSSGLTFKYGEFSAVSAKIFDGASHWNKPTTIKVHFIGSTATYDRMIDIGALRFNNNKLGQTNTSSPDIQVSGNSVSIPDGDNTPGTGDNTDFGSIANSTSTTKTFVIRNGGTSALSVTGITFNGTNSSEFSLVSAPSYPLSIAANGTYTITVKFAPATAGARTATLNIASNDPAKGTFDFAVKGTSVSNQPVINVQGNSASIADGDVTPVSTDNTDFGSIVNATSTTKTFVIQNNGTASLSVTGCTFTGTNSSEFTLVSAPSYPLSIAASSSYTITVKFAPASVGIRTATINIASNDPNVSNYDFALAGISTSLSAPAASVQGNGVSITDGDNTPSSTDNTDFGSISNASSTTKSFVIKNTGTAALTVTGCTFTGTNASEFSIASAPYYPLSIAANSSYTMTVKFAPTSAGTRTATMNIASNDPNAATYDFAIQGVSTLSGFTYSMDVKGNAVSIADGDNTPSSTDNTDFGSVPGNSSVNKTFTIYNTGTGDISIDAFIFTGTNPADFSIVNAPSMPFKIAASSSYSVTVKFTPSTTGTRSAILNIDNDIDGLWTHEFTIQGAIGTTSSPIMSVEGNSSVIADGDKTPSTADNTDFGAISNGTSTTKTFTVRNTGNAALSVTGCSFTGTNSSEFSLSGAPSFSVSVPANGSYNLTVRFAPASTGLRTASMNIASNDPAISDYDFAIEGTSNANTAPDVRVLGNSAAISDGDGTPSSTDNTDFGQITNNSTTTRSFVIENNGTAALTVNGCSFSGTNSSEFSLVSAPSFPLSIAAKGTYTITVKFAPASAGTRTAVMNISSNDPNIANYDFAVMGTSVAIKTTPDIKVQGNSVTIADGDATPSTVDNTDFGTIAAGSSVNRTFVIQNPGTGDLKVTALLLTGANPADFKVVNAPSMPLTVAAGTSYVVTLSFTPSATGTSTAVFNIDTDVDNVWTYEFAIQGSTNSSAPSIEVEGNSISIADGDNTPNTVDNTIIGSIKTGSNISKTFVIRNTGGAPLSVSGISFSGTNSSEFTLINAPSFPLSIASNGSYTITVKFLPTSVGTRNATINIASNDKSRLNYDFSLQGISNSTSVPVISVLGNSVSIADGDNTPSTSDNTNFGTVVIGRNIKKSFVIKNTGNSKLSITSISFSGTNSSDFSVASNISYPLSIAAGASYTVSVKFAALDAGTNRNGSINIASNDPSISNFDFALKGICTEVSNRSAIDETTIGEDSATANKMDFVPYPNPFVNDLNMSFDNSTGATKGYIRLLDVQGRVVYEDTHDLVEGKNVITLNFDYITSGIYYLSLKVGDTMITKAVQK
jgi:hypothetical protein